MSDRSIPVFTVRVIPPGAAAARLDESIRVTSMTYEDNEKLADKLTLTVDNFDLSLFDDPQFAQGNVLEVSWGYPGNMSAPRQCVIVKTTGFQVLTVEAHGKAILMNKVARVRTFSNMSRSDVAKQIAEENGYGADLQDIEDTGARLPQITQARMTDWQLLRTLAGREGFEIWVDVSGFHFHNRRLGQAPRRKFIWYTDPGPGDISSINIENDITARPGAVVTKGVDPMTKKPFSFTADNHGTSGRPALGPVLGVPEQDNAAEAVSKVGAITKTTKDQLKGAAATPTTETTEEAAKKQAAGIYSRSMTTAVKLSMDCVGDPQVSAKSVVEIAGIGTRLSGNYYLICATHKIGVGYMMSLKARRDGTSGVGVKSDGKVNKQKGPDEPSSELDVFEKVDKVGNKTTQYKPAGSSKGAGS